MDVLGRRISGRMLAGALLLVAGVLLLLQNLNVLGFVWDFVWAFLFGAGGLVFLVVFAGNRENWWAAIPGLVLLGLGTLIAFSALGWRRMEAMGGVLFLGSIGTSFWLVYLRTRENWWAIIPGGVLLTLSAVTFVDAFVPWLVGGGIFFLGLAATFFLLYLLPQPQGRMKWALIPAGVLLALGLVVTLAMSSVFQFVWPVALIVGGLYLLWRVFRPQ